MNPTRVKTQETIDTRVLLLREISHTPADKLAQVGYDVEFIEEFTAYDRQPAMPEVVHYWRYLCPLGDRFYGNGRA